MKMIHTLCIATPEYEKMYQVHNTSVYEYIPGAIQHRYYSHEFTSNYTNIIQHICSIRPKAILDVFNKNPECEGILFLGADVVFYNKPIELLNLIKYKHSTNVVVTPHITTPIQDDDKFPNNESIAKTGHINSDFVYWKKCPEVIEFLEWQAKIMETKCIEKDGIFLDQSWLNFLPFFVSNVKIFRDSIHMGYNVAYWCYKQRSLRKNVNGNWVVGSNHPLVCFQYSGLDLNNPKGISKYQNREVAEGDFLQFLTEYAEKVK